MTDGTNTLRFTYNIDGIRATKSDGTKTYEYIYNGSSLSQIYVGNDAMFFAYDANGLPMSITRNNITYFYILNVQGDVIGLLDTNGTQVVSYTYDAWGNILEISGTMADTIGIYNPLRYRGYVYDQETGLYYLQSRYYNPENARFLNADAFASTGQGVLSKNMFSYCLNNPINMVDRSGNKPGDLFATVDAAARDAAVYMVELGTFEDDWEYATSIYSAKHVIPYVQTIETKYQLFGFSWSTYTSTLQFKTITRYTYKTVTTDREADSVVVPNAPRFKTRVAGVHSHPFVPNTKSYEFSPKDEAWSKAAEVPLYLLTPNGYLRKYDGKTDVAIDVFQYMPMDPALIPNNEYILTKMKGKD